VAYINAGFFVCGIKVLLQIFLSIGRFFRVIKWTLFSLATKVDKGQFAAG
jgi:hypothetical protein